jgi:hypothetical protein
METFSTGDMATMRTLFSDLPPAYAGFLRMVAKMFQRWFSPLVLKFPTSAFSGPQSRLSVPKAIFR